MIQLYTWKTPNGRKPAILLEELGIPYTIVPIDLSKREQFSDSFSKVSPNNKIPGLVDNDITIFESGAILTYLAEKFEKYLPAHGPERYKVLEWTFWQVGGIGPILGQLGYFGVRAKEKIPQAIEHFKDESDRLLSVLDLQLEKNTYVAGNMYTIADMATYPWVVAAKEMTAKYKNVQRWMDMMGEKPAVKRGMNILN